MLYSSGEKSSGATLRRTPAVLTLLVIIVPYICGVLLLISIIGAIGSFRESRRSPYFRHRRELGQAGWRWTGLALLSVVIIYASTAVRPLLPPLEWDNLFAIGAEPTPTFDINSLFTVTSNSQTTPKDPLAQPPTITPTQPPVTASPTLPIATLQTTITPSADATLTISAIATGITADLEPADAGAFFSAGVPRLYFFIEFANMTDGAAWSRVLLLDRTAVRTETEPWSQGQEGTAYYWFNAQGGWPPGEYVVQFYLGDRLLAEKSFTLN
jgi:hypothetical protein